MYICLYLTIAVCICVLLNLDSLRQRGPEKELLGKHGWGLLITRFLTLVVLFLAILLNLTDDTLQEMTDESTQLDNLDYNHYMSTLSTVIMYNCNTVSDLAASDIVNHQICLSTHLKYSDFLFESYLIYRRRGLQFLIFTLFISFYQITTKSKVNCPV